MSGQHSFSLRGSRSFEMEEKKGPSVSVLSLPENDSRILLPTSESRHLTPSNWPSQPEPLRASRLQEIWMNSYDVFLCILPLAIAIKATLCIFAGKIDYRLAGPTRVNSNPFSDVLLWINEQMVTAFTIVFITVMSTLMRRYALWKAQHGAYISDLEQLNASISLPSTIKMIFYLRKFNLSSFGLLIVWSFYYLGSQASKREYVYALSDPFRSINISYPNANTYFDFAQTFNESSGDTTTAGLNYYSELVQQINMRNGVDVFGYLLVPDVRVTGEKDGSSRLRTNTELREWIDVNEPKNGIPTTSYAGRQLFYKVSDSTDPGDMWRPIGNSYMGRAFQVLGEYTFSTSYLDVKCGSPEALPSESFPAETANFSRTSLNLTISSVSTINNAARPQDFQVWNKWDRTHCSQCESEEPIIDSMTNGTIKLICNVTRPVVEIKAKCPDGMCLAKQIRYLGTYATNPFTNSTWATAFFDKLLWSTGYPNKFSEDDTDVAYEIGTWRLPMLLANSYSNSQIADTVDSIASQMTLLFNTYLAIGDRTRTLTDLPGYDPIAYDYFTLKGAPYDPRYEIVWSWLLLDYLACAILLAASVFSFWLRKQTLAPDIFGYVSSLTRDNPYIPVSEGGSTLSGLDRAKYMDKVKIRIGDVGQNSEVGKIGIVHIHDGVGAEPLKRERRYL